MGDVHVMRANNSNPPGDMGQEPPDNGNMETRLTKIEALLPHLSTKADIGDVRADIQKGISETQRWMIATVIGLFLGFGGLFLAMSNAFKPAATASSAQQAPIIINVPAAAATTAPPAKP